MTRRKKPPPHPKRQHITDSSGWTHVIKGPPSTIAHLKTTALRRSHETSPSSTNYSLETYLDKFHNHYLPTWKSSACFKHLSRMFEQETLSSAGEKKKKKKKKIKITQCVCLGLGSMTTGSESSSYELAALMSILEQLSTYMIHHSFSHSFIHSFIHSPSSHIRICT